MVVGGGGGGGGGGGWWCMVVEDGARQERSGQESVSSQLSVLRQCGGVRGLQDSSDRPSMTQLLICQCLLLTAGLALATDPPADLVSCLLSICWSAEKVSGDWPGLVLLCIDCSV